MAETENKTSSTIIFNRSMRKEDLDRANVRAEINVWKPKGKKEVLVDSKGQIFYVYFEKAFNSEKMAVWDEFYVKKSSFEPHLAMSAKYINYFINKYDKENELITAYLKLKRMMDKDEMFNASNPESLIDVIYEFIFTPTLCAKIIDMVEDNYLDDIERDSANYKGAQNKDYLQSLEFTNEHQKILLRISFGMRIICPVMFHYFTTNKIKPDDLKSKKGISIIYDFYNPLFPLFSGNVNMFNKLFVYIQRKVVDSSHHNIKMFEQADIRGEDIRLVIERFIKKQIISENMVKYQFNNSWDPIRKKYRENIIGFNKTVIKYQLIYFCKEVFGKNFVEMTNTKNSEGLAGSDKMEMNMKKLDVGAVDLAQINVETTIAQLMHDIDIPITAEEIQYYRDNHYPSDIQVHLFRSYYAPLFASYRDENLINRKQYNILLLLLKKKLLFDNGYEFTDLGSACYLPYILTGNLEGKANHKPIKDSKLISELEEDPLYEELVNNQYKELEEMKPGFVKGIISTFVNSEFTFVCYEDPELLGKSIDAPPRQLMRELLLFLQSCKA